MAKTAMGFEIHFHSYRVGCEIGGTSACHWIDSSGSRGVYVYADFFNWVKAQNNPLYKRGFEAVLHHEDGHYPVYRRMGYFPEDVGTGVEFTLVEEACDEHAISQGHTWHELAVGLAMAVIFTRLKGGEISQHVADTLAANSPSGPKMAIAMATLATRMIGTGSQRRIFGVAKKLLEECLQEGKRLLEQGRFQESQELFEALKEATDAVGLLRERFYAAQQAA